MSTGKTNLTSTQFAAKKLLGKAHTSNLKSDVNEIIPSNVSLPSEGVFAEAIPNNPGSEFFTLYSASAGAPATVEQVYFDIVSISDTTYDANPPQAIVDQNKKTQLLSPSYCNALKELHIKELRQHIATQILDVKPHSCI